MTARAALVGLLLAFAGCRAADAPYDYLNGRSIDPFRWSKQTVVESTGAAGDSASRPRSAEVYMEALDLVLVRDDRSVRILNAKGGGPVDAMASLDLVTITWPRTGDSLEWRGDRLAFTASGGGVREDVLQRTDRPGKYALLMGGRFTIEPPTPAPPTTGPS